MVLLKLVNLFVKRPGLHPILSALTAALAAAFLIATNSWIVTLGVMASASILTGAGLYLRNHLYKDPVMNDNNHEELLASQSGKLAAEGYIKWGKSFFEINAWKHPLIFGSSMLQTMQCDQDDALNAIEQENEEKKRFKRR
ncbi:MAG: hypothetical protein JSS07_10625 [Proteobacteria bacterium]|nr:hypothetical protein [Pseudomonadota bacterium]